MRAAGGEWQAPVNISAAGGDASGVDVAVDPAGNAVAVWDRPTGAGAATATHAVQAAARAAGATWQSPVGLSTASVNFTDPHVALDAQGAAVAVWTIDRPSDARGIVQGATRAAGAPWQGPVAIATAGSREGVLSPGVAVDGRGGAVALWEQTTTTRLRRRARAGRSCEAPTSARRCRGPLQR